jgi:hypothetical protein
MNRQQLKKTEGQYVRLQPPAVGPRGEEVDEDWLVREVKDDVIELLNTQRGVVAAIGFDHIFNYFSDGTRGNAHQRYGFLQLHSQVRIGNAYMARVEPLPPPRVSAMSRRAVSQPLIVRVGNDDRYFSWRGRDADAVHLVPREEELRQLFEAYMRICDAIRRDSGREPQFDLPNDLRGEVVYELSADGEARWRLLGGMGGKAGKAVLVLTDRPSRPVDEHIESTAPPEDEWVDAEYANASGLSTQLEEQGFSIHWVRDDRLEKRRRLGWEPVIVEKDGRRFIPKQKPLAPDVDPAVLVLMKHSSQSDDNADGE